jgi:hypothetical protein
MSTLTWTWELAASVQLLNASGIHVDPVRPGLEQVCVLGGTVTVESSLPRPVGWPPGSYLNSPLVSGALPI